jgi:hypothetical protein
LLLRALLPQAAKPAATKTLFELPQAVRIQEEMDLNSYDIWHSDQKR